MNVEKFQAIPAVAKFILLVHVAAASGAYERTPSLRVIDIEPVATYPAFEHLDVKIAVIDHVPETTFFAYHGLPLFLISYYWTHTYTV